MARSAAMACAETSSHSHRPGNIRVRIRVSFMTGAVRSAILATAAGLLVKDLTVDINKRQEYKRLLYILFMTLSLFSVFCCRASSGYPMDILSCEIAEVACQLICNSRCNKCNQFYPVSVCDKPITTRTRCYIQHSSECTPDHIQNWSGCYVTLRFRGVCLLTLPRFHFCAPFWFVCIF